MSKDIDDGRPYDRPLTDLVSIYDAGYCWSNFCEFVFYGKASWPSYCYWMVPGTITDVERAGWL